MTMHQPAAAMAVQKAYCYITSSEEGRPAFAVREDSGERVYVPYTISEALKLEEMERIQAILIVNDHPSTPWRAMNVQRSEH
jgi:hypothetical protein